MAAGGVFEGAGVTALGLAASRAVESGRPDRLIDDPHACRLFEAAGVALPMRTAWPEEGEEVGDTEALHLHGSRYIGLRTRFYDDRLLEAAAGGARQAVLLGAGLDTRALRLALPAALTVFELDRGDLLEYKRRVTGTPVQPVIDLGADLAEDAWADTLAGSVFEPGVATAWIAEGLVAYLDAGARAALADAVVRLSGPGSSFTFDQVVGGDVSALSERSGIDMATLFAADGEEQGLAQRLRDHGWSVETEGVEELAGRYGRDLRDPFGGDAAAPWLATAFVRARAC